MSLSPLVLFALLTGAPAPCSDVLDAVAALSPIAERMGLHHEKQRLEHNALRAARPEVYSALSSEIDLDADQTRLEDVHGLVSQGLGELELDGVVHGRVKTLYSTWKKMERKQIGLDQVFDRLALRARVDTVEDCYALSDWLSTRFDLVDGETDDYIASPKPNGYASLHLVLDLDHGPVEVQIRTHEMHQAAENGAAAHWRYKQAA